MTLINFRIFLFLCITGTFMSCAITKKSGLSQPDENITSLHYIGNYQIPFAFNFKNTTVGGLSGIDYDASNKLYYLICDDRSDINPARFYTTAIHLTQKGIDSVIFKGVYNMLQPNGRPYPNHNQHPNLTPDPEAMRFNPITQQLIWGNEGERIINKRDTILENPSIYAISTEGKFIDSFLIPPNLEMETIEKGPRQNGVLEGITFADDYSSVFVNIEEPLFEDGPRADTFENNAYIRILKFNTTDKKNTHQYGYKLDRVAHPAFPAGAFKINGVPDILSIGKNRLLVVERSFSFGRLASTIKVFIADFNNATDIKNIGSLKNNAGFVPATKKLLLNMDDLGIYIDNVEGVTFGPLLPNGHKSLLFVSDNNFSPLQQSQLFLFEVME